MAAVEAMQTRISMIFILSDSPEPARVILHPMTVLVDDGPPEDAGDQAHGLDRQKLTHTEGPREGATGDRIAMETAVLTTRMRGQDSFFGDDRSSASSYSTDHEDLFEWRGSLKRRPSNRRDGHVYREHRRRPASYSHGRDDMVLETARTPRRRGIERR